MSTEPPSPMDRLSPSWIRRSISRRKSSQEGESRPGSSNSPISSQATFSTSSSDNSHSVGSGKSIRRRSIRRVVQRLRSSSRASSPSNQSPERDINDIHDWFHGFQRYNKLITNNTSSTQPKDFTKTCKSLSKSCGGTFIHELPEAAFDFALLWCPAGPLTRTNLTEPSWSWTSYTGPVNFPFDPTTCPDISRTPRADGELFRSEIKTFHIGPEASQYTIRRDNSSALRIKYPPHFHAPRGEDPRIDSDTLRFKAKVISADGFTAEQLHYQDREIPCSQLINAENQHCGVIMHFEEAISQPSSTGPFEFVLLSRNLRKEPGQHTRRPQSCTMHPPGTPIWDGERFVWDEEVVDCDEEVFGSGEWKMLNVMLVKWVGECAERVAIARIHEDAWESREPRVKEIVLK